MSKRAKKGSKLDYRIYHKTGQKVEKSVSCEIESLSTSLENLDIKGMAQINPLKSKEKKIFTEFQNLDEIDDSNTINEIEEYLSEIRDIKRRYLHIHVDLEEELGLEAYKKQYKQYGNTVIEFKKLESQASKLRRKKKEEKEENLRKKELEERIRREEAKEKRRQEEKEERERIKKEEKEERERIQKEEKEERERIRLEEKEERMKFDMDRLAQENVKKEEEVKLRQEKTEEMERLIKEEKVERLRNEEEWKQKEKLEKEEKEKLRKEEKLAKEKMCTCLLNENDVIQNSIDSISVESLSDLNDEQIMIREKSLSSIDIEIHRFGDNVSKVIEQMPRNIDNYEDIINKYVSTHKVLLVSSDKYKRALSSEISDRKLSAEKMKSLPSLKIELQVFRGYESEIDIYTFQTEFEKLFESSVQRKFLPDYLKSNYLKGSALALVKNMDNLEEIWTRLKEAFGNTEMILKSKLKEIEKLGSIWKIKDNEKLVQILSKLIFAMTELKTLAEKYCLEGELYYNNAILVKIYDIMGFYHRDRFIRMNDDSSLKKKEMWGKLSEYLKNELKFREKLILVEKVSPLSMTKPVSKNSSFQGSIKSFYSKSQEDENTKCHLCGKYDHVVTKDYLGRNVVEYFSCEKFAKSNPFERGALLKAKGLCRQCLNPGAKENSGVHKTGRCYSRFSCKHELHKKYDRKWHVLLCHLHKNSDANVALITEFKEQRILKVESLPDYSKQIKISFHIDNVDVHKGESKHCNLKESSIYVLQTVQVEGELMKLFFDSGCCDLVSRKRAIDCLQKLGRANLEIPGPIPLFGVGNQKSESKYGIYKVSIPLHNGTNAVMSGVCLEHVTKPFPVYPLAGIVEDDVRKAYELEGKNPDDLPRLPKFVAGETDLMVGVQYLKYFPERIFQLPNGLTIYKSSFKNPDGSRGVVGGPHHIFAEIEKQQFGGHLSINQYCSEQVKLVKMGYRVSLDISMLGIKRDIDNLGSDFSLSSKHHHTKQKNIKAGKLFESIEKAGTEILYRCANCRNCSDCKNSEKIEFISIQEEVEQNIIDKSVHVNLVKGETIAKLPFISNPVIKLAPNRDRALAVYKAQVKKLSKNPNDRNDVIKSENKLQKLGYVDYMDDLSVEQKSKIRDSSVKYYIPWRAVWNLNSVSTPCRLVFDASHGSSSGYSLNDVLAKGRNNMNKLVEICIRWAVHIFAFHTDIKTMYNSVKLSEEDWCYQLYLWDNELNPENVPRTKVIKTLIYGVKSSGNQAERGLRKTAELQKQEYPRCNDIIQRDIYVDDCLSGDKSSEVVYQLTDNMKVVLNKGGFCLKGLTFSGKDPPVELSSDGISINVAGVKWYSKEDVISLKSGELNFAKKHRGKKPLDKKFQIPTDFTRRDCVSKVAEVFDILGKVTPLTCGMKLDLRELVRRKLDWDDKIPDDLKATWISNFETIRDISNIRFRRAIVPVDAVSLDIETIDIADASENLACSAIYARFKRQNGTYSCHMIFARSKILPENITVPRAELTAAHLNATTAHVVKLSLGPLHKKCIKLTDSQVALQWISNSQKTLKQWVRNRVIEINRLSDRSLWRHIDRKHMIADMGTRKGAKICDVSDDSVWINGLEWMKKDFSEFPVLTVSEINLSRSESSMFNEEVLKSDNVELICIDAGSFNFAKSDNLNMVLEMRYKFCNYIIDPNRFRLRKVVNILALVLLFIKNLKSRVQSSRDLDILPDDTGETEAKDNLTAPSSKKVEKYLVTEGKIHRYDSNVEIQCKQGQVIILHEDDIKESFDYFYRKSTLEIKHFLHKKDYNDIADEKNGILYYKGRILPTQLYGVNLLSKKGLSDVMIDLTASSFCVPLVDYRSPFAFSIVSEVHWHDQDAKHSGVETVLRYTQKLAHIIGGRELVKKFKKGCVRCRILAMRTLEVAMGPVKQCNLNIAPPFYMTQVDIFGPLDSFSSHNKRATVKIWFIIFCCSTTGAISMKIMEDYSTNSFLLGFIRFSCTVGYPKMLMPDEGSQLIKGCKDMQIDYYDLQHKLNRQYGVEFQTCPVGGHNVHGKVERKIKHIQDSIAKGCNKERLSVIQWETLGDQIANSINNLPVALGNEVSDLENLDLLTPNRLMLGRNNSRSPSGPLVVTNDPSKIMRANLDIFEVWFQSWLVSCVPKLMVQPKWFRSDRDVKIGDIVLFLKTEKEYARNYQYGMIKEIEISRDGKIRTVLVEYCNFNENVKRVTRRSIREVVMVHTVDEIDILQELGAIAKIADLKFATDQWKYR